MSAKVKNVVAYVLIRVVHGANEEVLEGLGQLEEVTESSMVFGEFDIHCKIEVDDIHKLAEVVEKVREFFYDLLKETSKTKIGDTQVRRNNLSPEDDVNIDLHNFIQTFLKDLQRRILFRLILKLKLEDSREYVEFLVFGNPFFKAYENELVNKCLKDEKYEYALFSRLEELIEEVKKKKKNSYLKL